MAGINAADLAAGAFSMAGGDWQEDFELLQSAMRARGFGKRIVTVNDSVGALRAGSASGPAVVSVCGTGVATAARDADGRIWHSSWWQDVQGAYQLAEKTLKSVYRAELGINPPTALTAAVLKHFNRNTVEEVLYIFYSRGENPDRAKMGGLARVLFDTVEAGDPVAVKIATEHGAALGDYVLAAARQVDIEREPFTLVLAGGVLRHASRLMPEALIARVQSVSPGVTPVYSIFEPAVGALLLAFDAAGITVDEPLLERLTATLPSSSLFAT
jgi:N-acetylglucosamine kinase-like BadF-type ATPase